MSDPADGKRDFFVSFNQADRAWATWIAWALEEAGYSVFFQDWDFQGNFVLEMDKAHAQSRRTIAVLSPEYLASRFTAPEWAARFAQDATSEHDLLIPVRVQPCELEGLLAQIVYVDLIGCDEAAAKKRLLDRVSGIRAKPDEPPLYPKPSTAGHTAVPKRPDYPGVVRTAGRWLHQALIGGGIAAAVVGALLTWWLSAPPTQTSVDIQNQGGQIGQVVTGPVAGDVIGQQTTVHGVPFDEYKQIRDELGVTDEALASFFAIVERERVPRHELEPTLKEIAGRYKELLARLGTTGSTDPEVQRLKEQAREALRVGDFDQAEELLNQAKARDLSAIERMEADLDARKLSAAEAAAENGALMMTQIRYTDAARYYAEAAELTPETRADQLSERLRDWAEAARRAGDFPAGLAAAERALAIDQGRLPAADTLLATDLNNLALLYQATGRYAQAEPLYQRAIAIGEKTLGPEHPDLATQLNNLAVLYQATGRYAQAEPLYQRAIAIGEKTLGPEHPDLATGSTTWPSSTGPPAATRRPSRSTSAPSRSARRRSAPSTPTSPPASTTWPCSTGPPAATRRPSRSTSAPSRSARRRSAPSTPTSPSGSTTWPGSTGPPAATRRPSRSTSAPRYPREGPRPRAPRRRPVPQQPGRALPGHRPLRAGRAALPARHRDRREGPRPRAPDLATSLNNLAELYRATGRYAQAEPLYERAIAIGEKALGPEHPDLATRLNNLAGLYRDTGRYAQAEPLYERAIAIGEKTLGPEHPDLATRLNNLALLYRATGRYARGRAALPARHRDPGQEPAAGPSEPGAVRENYAILLDQLGRGEEASELRAQAEAIRQRRERPPSPPSP